MFKNRAIKKYFRQFYPFLYQRYGASDSYTKGQVLRTASECGFKEKYAVYALGIFMEKTDFYRLIDEYPDIVLKEVRKEIADKFFGGDEEYSFKQYRKKFIGNNGHCSSGVGEGAGE